MRPFCFPAEWGGAGVGLAVQPLLFQITLEGGGGGAVILHHNFSHSLSVPFQFMPNFVTC